VLYKDAQNIRRRMVISETLDHRIRAWKDGIV